MSEHNTCQITIHVPDNTTLRFPTANDFLHYVNKERKVSTHNSQGVLEETWRKFDHLPLLKVVDDVLLDEYVYQTEEALLSAFTPSPGKTKVLSSKDDSRHLIIIGIDIVPSPSPSLDQS